MRKRTLLCLIGVGTVSLAIAVYMNTRSQDNAPAIVHLPDISEIKTVTAQINDLKDTLGILPIPEFAIPPEHIPTLLLALTPAEPNEELKHFLAHSPVIGHVTLVTKDGKGINFDYYWMGQNPLVFSVDGVLCSRGGDYKPFIKSRDYEMYTDESLLLHAIIEAIYREEVKGYKTNSLPRLIKLLRTSTGKDLADK